MYTIRLVKTGFAVVLLASALLLNGCDSDGSKRDSASDSGGGTGPGTTEPAGNSSVDTIGQAGATRSVISEDMPYAEVGDQLAYGYFVAPSDMIEPLPAVILIHEWWGLNEHVRAMADRLAAQGYIVLAVDLFGGETATSPAAARKLMLDVVEDPEQANENIRSAYNFVSATAGAPKVGAIGWRFGGTWALNTAILFPEELDASVIYYAQVTNDEEKLRPVSTPILGLFAGDDINVSVESVEAFENVLLSQRKDHEIQMYTGVRQGFANATQENYDAAAADDAWSRTLEFLSRHLSGDDASSDVN